MRKIYRHPGFLPFMTILVTSVAAGAMLASCATSSQVADPSPTAVSPDGKANALEALTLTRSIQENLTGLALETPESRERIIREAQAFASVRGKGRKGAPLRKARVDECQKALAEAAEAQESATDLPADGADSEDDIGIPLANATEVPVVAEIPESADAYDALFCRLWIESTGARPPRPKRTPSLSKTPWGRKRLQDLKTAIASARIERLADASDSEIRQALKKSPNISKLRPLVEKALDNRACVPTALLTGLGHKTEENFPDPDYRDLAQALYSRSVECGNDDAAGRAAYRLGLLQIWEERYAEAEKTLEWLSRNPAAVDYASRITYWRFFCAKQTGNVAIRDQMKEKLSKDYHLTLHGLITVGPKPTDNKPMVAFSSKTHPQLNASVRVAEALIEQGLERDAISALEPVLDGISAAEPAFQLYVGLVLKRAGDSIRKFKVLTGLYRDNPGMISRESLEMLFPLHRFEMVRSYEQKADPYLMISLIRQESAFNDRARSPVGARGLMQLMPATARRMERVSKNDLYNPTTNIRLGVRFFSHLTNRYGGEAELALAAYNAGPMNVDTWQNRYPVSNRMLFVDLIPFRETREYVASIARNYYWYKKLYEAAPETAQTGPTPIGVSGVSGVSGALDRQPSLQSPKFSFFKLFDS
jgi:soluble lytic murein transglycosylase